MEASYNQLVDDFMGAYYQKWWLLGRKNHYSRAGAQ
jgi:hypothetical protein